MTDLVEGEQSVPSVGGLEGVKGIEGVEDNVANNTGLQEINFEMDNIPEDDAIEIVERKDVYYKMYRDARKKAKLAKELSIASYLEAQKIKNTYMLDDIDDSDSENDENV